MFLPRRCPCSSAELYDWVPAVMLFVHRSSPSTHRKSKHICSGLWVNSQNKECSCHTHSIYLGCSVRQKQNLPLSHRKKKNTDHATDSARFAFRFFSRLLFSSLSSFVLQSYLSTVAVWWNVETANIFRRPAGISHKCVLESMSCTDTINIDLITATI